MVKGLDTFRKYFADYESQYVLIGDAACDILFEISLWKKKMKSCQQTKLFGKKYLWLQTKTLQ